MTQHDRFNEIVRKYQLVIGSIISKRLNTKEDVDDALQDLWIKVFRYLDEIDPKSEFQYIYRMAQNVVTDRMRKTKTHPECVDAEANEETIMHHASDALTRTIAKETLNRLLAKDLSETERAIIKRIAETHENASNRIAEAINVHSSTVCWNLRKIRKRLLPLAS